MMPADNPLVTVYMPTYNRASLLSRAIESVLAQTYSNFELIIVDDGSTDNTHELLAAYAKQDSRVTYYINEHNQGACVSRNRAIKKAQGEFVTALDDDDYFLPNRLSVLLDNWFKLPDDKAFIFSNKKLLRVDGDAVIKGPWYIRYRKFIKKEDLLVGCPVGIAFLATRDSLIKIDGFDESMPMWQDLDCVYRLLQLGTGYYINDTSYVVDITHDEVRISDANIKKLMQVHEYFCNKHQLNNIIAKNLMKMHFFSYGEKHIKFVPSLLCFFYRPNLTHLKYLIKSLYFK